MLYNPIVFIPGIFGSMGDDIIPGTGKFDFGMAEYAYRPIIDNLEKIGYKEGKDLFIAYYDWTKSNIYSAENYLIPVIKKAKKLRGRNRINLICHSMGGIVARSYIQTKLYNNDVQKLIMIGTPNSGAVNAYSFWSGGVLPYEKVEKNVLYRLLKESFLWLFRTRYPKKQDIEILRRLFPSCQDLLPSYEYGDYLYIKENNINDRFVPIKEMSIKNELLNELTQNKFIGYRYGVRTYLIVGTGVQTNNLIIAGKTNNDSIEWKDGKQLYTVKTLHGDGTVTCNSAKAFPGKVVYLYSDHTEILKDSSEVIANILKHKVVKIHENIDINKKNKLYSILADNANDIEIKFDNRELSIKKSTNIVDDRYIVRKVGENTYWIMLRAKIESDIDIEITPQINKEANLLILREEENKTITMVKEGIIKSTLTMSL